MTLLAFAVAMVGAGLIAMGAALLLLVRVMTLIHTRLTALEQNEAKR